MKYWMRFALICGVVALGVVGNPINVHAQQASSYQALSDKFFDLLKQDYSSDAVDHLLNTNPTAQKKKADQLKVQLASMRTILGPYISHTMLVETKVAGIYVYQHYFVAYERQPISIRIKYYKPDTTWICQSLQIDTDVDEVIQKNADARIPAE